MNLGKGITWLSFVVVLNLVSPHKGGNTVDAVRTWAGLGPANPPELAAGVLRMVRADLGAAARGGSVGCGDRARAAARAGCGAGARIEPRAPVTEGAWHATR